MLVTYSIYVILGDMSVENQEPLAECMLQLT